MRRFLVLVMNDRKIVGYLTRDFLKVEELNFNCIHFGDKEVYNEVVVKRNSKYGTYNLLVCPYNGVLGDTFCKGIYKKYVAPTVKHFHFEDEIIDKIQQSDKYDFENFGGDE